MANAPSLETSKMTRAEIWAAIEALVALGVPIAVATERFGKSRDSYYKRNANKKGPAATEPQISSPTEVGNSLSTEIITQPLP